MTLEAVHQAALVGAAAEADALRRAAEARAQQILAESRAEAAEMVAGRRAVAEKLAELEERERLAAARAEAREIVLGAQRSVLSEATAAAHAAGRRLLGDARYGLVLARRGAEARERLTSADGPVEITLASDGGLMARAGSRELDYSLRAEVDRCLQAMGSELDRLWQ